MAAILTVIAAAVRKDMPTFFICSFFLFLLGFKRFEVLGYVQARENGRVLGTRPGVRLFGSNVSLP